jgi:hypothetical protein
MFVRVVALPSVVYVEHSVPELLGRRSDCNPSAARLKAVVSTRWSLARGEHGKRKRLIGSNRGGVPQVRVIQ